MLMCHTKTKGHGYWFHGLLGNFASYYSGATNRWKKMMKVQYTLSSTQIVFIFENEDAYVELV